MQFSVVNLVADELKYMLQSQIANLVSNNKYERHRIVNDLCIFRTTNQLAIGEICQKS